MIVYVLMKIGKKHTLNPEAAIPVRAHMGAEDKLVAPYPELHFQSNKEYLKSPSLAQIVYVDALDMYVLHSAHRRQIHLVVQAFRLDHSSVAG